MGGANPKPKQNPDDKLALALKMTRAAARLHPTAAEGFDNYFSKQLKLSNK